MSGEQLPQRIFGQKINLKSGYLSQFLIRGTDKAGVRKPESPRPTPRADGRTATAAVRGLQLLLRASKDLLVTFLL